MDDPVDDQSGRWQIGQLPIADIRRILAGTSDAERRQLFRDHRARLEARLDRPGTMTV